MKLTSAYFNPANRKRSGRYAKVGKIPIYYEVYGAGKPLLLFHGGLSCIDGLRYQIPFFARHFKVIVPERPGHGHTRDIHGSYTYEKIASQMAGFMKALRIRKARMMGYSDGANLIYWLASKKPELVERFISVGGNFHYSGCDFAFQKELKKQKVTEVDPRYAAYSPDGAEHYPETFEKCRKLWLTEPKWKASVIQKIKVPALILAGDRDVISHEHTLKLFRHLRTAQLAIIPGASHSLLKEKPRLVNSLMLEFLKQSIF